MSQKDNFIKTFEDYETFKEMISAGLVKWVVWTWENPISVENPIFKILLVPVILPLNVFMFYYVKYQLRKFKKQKPEYFL